MLFFQRKLPVRPCHLAQQVLNYVVSHIQRLLSTMKILVLNSASSSQKACLYEIDGSPANTPPGCLWEGKIDWSNDGAVVETKNEESFRTVEKIRGAPVPSLWKSYSVRCGTATRQQSNLPARLMQLDIGSCMADRTTKNPR